ncbi:Gfo/Idh/MocA family oxidoreductase [Actinopolymorpha alba]|uniref:Gfo/Idh/MocA family protein n=1 Tax=Actinopolymorpha alba TaxID=533267 RepID=UPI00036DCEBB|nr:Gfo/Idh/MocA family oxidoreductase [Actinopolymorpha alba]
MKVGLVGVGRIGALHAETLRDLPEVETLFLADADVARARDTADKLGISSSGSVAELLASRPDGIVIAAATTAHAELVHLAADAGVAVFCEKPLASDVAGTREVIAHVAAAGVPLQMGFQRRFDPGYQAARARLQAGELGWLHSVWACTLDPAPPHASYIPTSGGLFRDCSVHDIDAIRWVTGREVAEVRATGANKGADFFAAAGDVDTAHALLTLDDGTLAALAATRYNGAGYDVRLELHGSRRTFVVGLDDRAPLASAEAGVTWPTEPSYANFAERFRSAYAAELRAFVDVMAGRTPSPCSGEDALEALYVAEACELSRRESRTVRIEEVRR